MPLEDFWRDFEEAVQEDKAERERMKAEMAKQRATQRRRR